MLSATKATVAPEFKDILFLTDFSPCSEAALPYARAIAERYGSTIHIVHVVGPEPMIGPLGVPYPQAEHQNLVAQRAMDKLIHSRALRGALYTQTIHRGLVWEVMSKLVADLKIDVIVLGTHGRGGLKHIVLGSVAEKVFRHAACPVMTVGPEAHNGLAEGKLNTIVYATDFSPASRGALPYALSFVRANRSKLILVHAIFPFMGDEEFSTMSLEEMVKNAKQELTNLVGDDPDINYQVIVKHFPAAELILDVTADSMADLVVMGAHRGTSSRTPWAVAHRVVCHATCPVLTVPG